MSRGMELARYGSLERRSTTCARCHRLPLATAAISKSTAKTPATIKAIVVARGGMPFGNRQLGGHALVGYSFADTLTAPAITARIVYTTAAAARFASR